jgi:hypothetical protein
MKRWLCKCFVLERGTTYRNRGDYVRSLPAVLKNAVSEYTRFF